MPTGPDQATSLATYVNTATETAAREFLAACCDVPAWVDHILGGRPYTDDAALYDAADRAARGFTADDVDRALTAHPRIGEKASGGSPQARWSRTEQSAVARDEATTAALACANHAYEERFGRVFLICASGLSAEEILGSARDRLHNTDDDELFVVADELRKIALVRLQKGPSR